MPGAAGIPGASMSLPPDPLDPLLDRWKEPGEPTTNLAPEVWRRIALREIAACLARPPFAAMFVVSCAILGLFLAEVRVNHEQRERSAQLARSYLQLIDPLLKEAPASKAP
jgi:hypothetical protein